MSSNSNVIEIISVIESANRWQEFLDIPNEHYGIGGKPLLLTCPSQGEAYSVIDEHFYAHGIANQIEETALRLRQNTRPYHR